jgi:ATP-binding protein involved in chromosome partitioning
MLIKNDFLRKIYQKNNFEFTIEWMDGEVRDYRLSDIQKKCFCARCVDEITGTRLLDPATIPYDLMAKKLYNVGRYALKIEFCSGCSRGIYPYSWLKQWPLIQENI